jgi:hypothetical protein
VPLLLPFISAALFGFARAGANALRINDGTRLARETISFPTTFAGFSTSNEVLTAQ